MWHGTFKNIINFAFLGLVSRGHRVIVLIKFVICFKQLVWLIWFFTELTNFRVFLPTGTVSLNTLSLWVGNPAYAIMSPILSLCHRQKRKIIKPTPRMSRFLRNAEFIPDEPLLIFLPGRQRWFSSNKMIRHCLTSYCKNTSVCGLKK